MRGRLVETLPSPGHVRQAMWGWVRGRVNRNGFDALVARLSRAIRRLPVWMGWALLHLDILLAGFVPFWAGFLERRWTGNWSSSLGWAAWARGWRYGWARLTRPGFGLGSASDRPGQIPQARATVPERPRWQTPGSCSGCKDKCCCHIRRPGKAAAPCPFFDASAQGCRIYGGLWWDYGPCGRYPKDQRAIDEYGCPRFRFPDAPAPVELTRRPERNRRRAA